MSLGVQAMTGPFSASQFAVTAVGGGPGGQLVLWTDTEKVTPYSPYCIEQMTRVETVYKHGLKIVDKLRCCAQPNPLLRGERLVASDVPGATSERLLFCLALRDAVVCFDNMKPLTDYMNELATVLEEAEKHQDTYLRRVVLFGVKPIKKYVDEVYPMIKKEYAEMGKRREKFDTVRARLAKGESPDVVQKVKTAQMEFAEKANVVGAMFKDMPMHQMALSKAIDDCARSEADFCGQAAKAIDAVKPPDYKKRWEV